MDDFKIRSDSVNVEHIMQQIRARIREKRGVDYTEQQVRDLAAAAFERVLDPKGARGGLLDAYRQGRVPAAENYPFEDTTLFDSHRAPLRWIRHLLRPVLKLFFNPNPLIQALHLQAGVNERNAESSRLTYELLYNLVLETTRLTVELEVLKMRVESATARLDFAERRSRVAESRAPHRTQEAQPTPQGRARGGPVRTPPVQPAQPTQPAQPVLGPAATGDQAGSAAKPQAARDGDQAGSGEARRRKRRRRGRRGGTGRGAGEAATEGAVGGADTGGDPAPADDRERQAEPGDRHDEPTGRDAGSGTPPPAEREEQ